MAACESLVMTSACARPQPRVSSASPCGRGARAATSVRACRAALRRHRSGGFRVSAQLDEEPSMQSQDLEPGELGRSLVGSSSTALEESPLASFRLPDAVEQKTAVQSFLYPDAAELPDDVQMTIWDHLEELRERAAVSAGAVGLLVLGSFSFSKQLVLFLQRPVAEQGVRFLQLAPGEYFFTTVKVAGYSGLLLGAPVVLYEVIAFVLPGLTRSERKFLAPIVLGSSVLFYAGLAFSYSVLAPAALNFFVSYADTAVESLWSIDQYFEFLLVLMLSTGLAFQVPVIQILLGGTRLVSATQMFAAWRYVVVGATVAAAVLTPSTDPFTQMLLAAPLVGLYLGGASVVALQEGARGEGPWAKN